MVPSREVEIEKTILIVEDEDNIRDLIQRYLKKEGYRTFTASTGLEALKQLKTEPPDLIILDLMLPEMNGLDVCKRIRADSATAMTPILILTAKADESDIILGLELGADDYMTKPFSLKTLVARVKALLRRLERIQKDPPRYVYGPLTVDVARHEVHVNSLSVQLTIKEFGLLIQLLQNVGRVVTRDALMQSVWEDQDYETARTVDVHIRRLKQKIPLLEEAITSIKSLGYKLKEPPSQ